jgi:hypothetical protein
MSQATSSIRESALVECEDVHCGFGMTCEPNGRNGSKRNCVTSEKDGLWNAIERTDQLAE